MRVGEKETSEQAEIVRRYADLFSRAQLDALREAEEAATGDERERLYRLRKTCEGGPARERARRALGRAREPPARRARRRSRARRCRCARRRRSSPCCRVRRPRGARRDPGRGERRVQPRPARAADRRARSSRPSSPGIAEPGRAQRGGEGDLAPRALAWCSTTRATPHAARSSPLRDRWFERLLGPERDEVPSSYHMSYMRRLSPLEATYTKERATEVCLATLERARLRPRRGDEHQARPRRPAAEGAARLRDRERPAERRPPDHARAGRPARLPGVPARGGPRAPLRRRRPGAADRVPPPRARPRADGDLLVHRRGDLAASPGGTPATSASPTSRRPRTPRRPSFLEAILFRRYEAKLRYELDFWSRFAEVGGTPDGYEEYLTAATGVRYRSCGYLADMDAGFYSADYLRAWVRSAQLRRYLIENGRRRLVAEPRHGRAPARALPRGHEALERGDRARGSATTRSTRRRSCTSSAPDARSASAGSRGRARARPASG